MFVQLVSHEIVLWCLLHILDVWTSSLGNVLGLCILISQSSLSSPFHSLATQTTHSHSSNHYFILIIHLFSESVSFLFVCWRFCHSSEGFAGCFYGCCWMLFSVLALLESIVILGYHSSSYYIDYYSLNYHHLLNHYHY